MYRKPWGKAPCRLKPALSGSWALSSSGAPPQAEQEPFSVDEEEEAEATDHVHKVGYVEMRGTGQNKGGVSSNSSWQRDGKDSEKVLTNNKRGFYGDSSQGTKIDMERMEGDPTSGRL